jgi:hypothetical protein
MHFSTDFFIFILYFNFSSFQNWMMSDATGVRRNHSIINHPLLNVFQFISLRGLVISPMFLLLTHTDILCFCNVLLLLTFFEGERVVLRFELRALSLLGGRHFATWAMLQPSCWLLIRVPSCSHILLRFLLLTSQIKLFYPLCNLVISLQFKWHWSQTMIQDWTFLKIRDR